MKALKVACNWFADVNFLKSVEEDFATILSFQLDRYWSYLQRTSSGWSLNHCTVRRSTHGQFLCYTEAIWWFNADASRWMQITRPAQWPKEDSEVSSQRKRANPCCQLKHAKSCNSSVWMSVTESLHQMSESPMQNPLSREELAKQVSLSVQWPWTQWWRKDCGWQDRHTSATLP